MRSESGKFMENGAFIPIGDLIKEHAPHLYELYKPYWHRLPFTDGKIYTLPEVIPYGKDIFATVAKGWWIQKAVIEWAGYPKLKHLDDYFDLIEKYKKEFPQIDGQDTIGFEILTEGWRLDYFLSSQLGLTGYPNDGAAAVDLVNGKWTAKEYWNSDVTHNIFKKYNNFYNRGLMNPSSLVATYDQYSERVHLGGCLAYSMKVGNLQVLKQYLKEKNQIE